MFDTMEDLLHRGMSPADMMILVRTKAEAALITDLKTQLDPDTYLHITRYFPRYRYTIPATDVGLMRRLKDIAEESLHNVFLGNVW